MHDLAAICADKSRDKELTWFHLYMNRLTWEIGECDRGLARLKTAIEVQKEAVIAASKNRKTIASMKAKKEREFFVELDRQEQKEIDDLVVTHYSKAKPEKQNPAELGIVRGAAKQEGCT